MLAVSGTVKVWGTGHGLSPPTVLPRRGLEAPQAALAGSRFWGSLMHWLWNSWWETARYDHPTQLSCYQGAAVNGEMLPGMWAAPEQQRPPERSSSEDSRAFVLQVAPKRQCGKSTTSRRANKGQWSGSENVAKYVWIPACSAVQLWYCFFI